MGEWYFLCQYAMLKAVPNKNAGFIVLLTSIFALLFFGEIRNLTTFCLLNNNSFSDSLALTPTLACLLELNHTLDMHNSPLPEGASCHITSLLVTTHKLELIKHLLAGLCAGLWWGKPKWRGTVAARERSLSNWS